ncbi:MAG: hypothetical protein ACYCSO_05130 [Cuniculiplasma sp.]
MSWLSYLDPLNWPKDLTSGFVTQLENGLLYLLSLVLNSFLGIINSTAAIFMGLFKDMVLGLIGVSELLGPLALPVFTIGMISVIGFAYVAFGILKDTPVVGGFV